MWCVSNPCKGFGYIALEDSLLWGCAGCRKPSRMVFEKVTDMRVPHKATAILGSHGGADGVWHSRFATENGIKTCLTYHPYPRKVDMDQGRELLLQTWKKLDAHVDIIKDPKSADELFYSKAAARTLAEVLVMFMKPFYATSDDIVREAMNRWKSRQDATEHETPGLAEVIWDPTKNWDGSDRTLPGAGVKTAKKIPETALNSSIKGIMSGMFTVSQIAKMYDTTEEQVKVQLGLP